MCSSYNLLINYITWLLELGSEIILSKFAFQMALGWYLTQNYKWKWNQITSSCKFVCDQQCCIFMCDNV